MGSDSSKTAELATEIAKLHDVLVKHYNSVHKYQYAIGVANLLFYFFIAILFGFTIFHWYLDRGEYILDILESAARHELVIFSIGTSIWALVTALIKSAHSKRIQSIKGDRCKLTSLANKYEDDSQIDRIRKTLKKAGKDINLSLPDLSPSEADFGVRSAASPRNSIFTRISEAISGDGPDRRYALICPSCRNHNGLVDKYEIPNLKYKCRHCKEQVTATEVVVKKRDVQSVTKKTFENMENLTVQITEDDGESSDDSTE